MTDSMEVINKIQNLVVFFTQQAVSLSEVGAEIFPRESPPNLVEWYYESVPFNQKEQELNLDKIIIKLPELESNLSEIISKWFEIYEKAKPAMGLYLSAITEAHKYLDTICLAVCQAAETYQRRTSGDEKLTFRSRIEKLLALFSGASSLNPENFLDDTVNTRNYLTHYNEKIKEKAKAGVELYVLNRSIRNLITANILKNLGFEVSQIEKNHPEQLAAI